MSRQPCRSKQALLRGLRPNSISNQTNLCGICSSRCIYCDIWKLAALVSSHVPLSRRLRRSTSNASQSSKNSFDYAMSEKAIEAQFQQQRARLAGIMSICTVDGAEECEGLRVAHDRCFGSVAKLMQEERMIQERAGNSQRGSSNARRASRNCGSSRGQYSGQRRPSLVGMAT